MHVPNRLSIQDKEKWILTTLHIMEKRYAIPIIAHIDLNANLAHLHQLKRYLNLKAWNQFQDDNYSWRVGRKKSNNDLLVWKW